VQDGLADLLQATCSSREDVCCQSLTLPEDAQEDVARSDLVLLQVLGLPPGELEDLLGSRGETERTDSLIAAAPSSSTDVNNWTVECTGSERFFDPSSDLVQVDPDRSEGIRLSVLEWRRRALPDDADHLATDVTPSQPLPIESARSNTARVPQQTEQDVLRADVVVTEASRFFLRVSDRSLRIIGEPDRTSVYLRARRLKRAAPPSAYGSSRCEVGAAPGLWTCWSAPSWW